MTTPKRKRGKVTGWAYILMRAPSDLPGYTIMRAFLNRNEAIQHKRDRTASGREIAGPIVRIVLPAPAVKVSRCTKETP